MFQQEGYNFVGACMEVYNTLGYGLYEEIYQQSLEIELENQNIPFSSKKAINTFYKGIKLEKVYIPDLTVYDKIMVELKSVQKICSEHEGQLFNYMKLTESKIGYLINFGHKSKLEWKRYILT